MKLNWILLLVTLVGCRWALATHPPVAEEGPLGWQVGLQKQLLTSELNANPVDLDDGDIQPPFLTLRGSYQPNYKAIFQPDIHLGVSAMENSGFHIYLSGGGWFDFEKFHLFFGGEVVITSFEDDIDSSAFASTLQGGYIKAGLPLGRFYPVFEVRFRELGNADLSQREGLTTQLGHSTDRIYRAHLNVELQGVDLWSALTLYSVGETAIASDGFAIGIEEKTYPIYSIGGGADLEAIGAKMWLKYHVITGIEDETAFYYQVPQIYPDFLPAKQSAVVELLWNF